MEADGHLLAIDDLVRNAGVIPVHLEALVDQVALEFAVEQQGGLKHPVEGGLQTDVQDFLPVL